MRVYPGRPKGSRLPDKAFACIAPSAVGANEPIHIVLLMGEADIFSAAPPFLFAFLIRRSFHHFHLPFLESLDLLFTRIFTPCKLDHFALIHDMNL